jgi:hypothetical protein
MATIKEKKVWAMYVNVGRNASEEESFAHIKKVKEELNLESYEDLVCLFIPVRGDDADTRIEVIQ